MRITIATTLILLSLSAAAAGKYYVCGNGLVVTNPTECRNTIEVAR